jgi:hypothetical protein
MAVIERVDTMKVRQYMFMAAIADRLEERLSKGGSFDLDGIPEPWDLSYPAELDKRGADIVLKSRKDDAELVNMAKRANSGSAWLRCLRSAHEIVAKLHEGSHTPETLNALLASHADLTDLVRTPHVEGSTIRTRLLPKTTFEKAVATSITGEIDHELARAVQARVERLAPAHPLRTLLVQISVFLSMIASSSRETEDAVNMTSAFLKRFEDEAMITRLAKARDAMQPSADPVKMWTLQLMCTATFRMKSGVVMMRTSQDAVSVLDLPNGLLLPTSSSVSLPLAGYAIGREDGRPVSPTRH